jgi:CDP-diacylglycerol--serine O-phosphatidyltransferase
MRFTKPIRSNDRQFNAVPSLFTLGNALCGLAAIITLSDSLNKNGGFPDAALWLIFCAMLFDVLDGLAARLLHAESMHGMNLDSLADIISFGAAPAVLIYVSGISAAVTGLPMVAVYLLCGLYLACAMWRLAVYNSRVSHGIKEQHSLMFTGLPSPAAAAMICSMAWLMSRPQSPVDNGATYMAYVLPVSLLMVCSAAYPHLRNLTEHLPAWLSVILGISALSLVGFTGLRGLVILSHLYVLSAPVYGLVRRTTRKTAGEMGADPVRHTKTMTD